ncbi:hypothetical protein EHF36_09425 [Kerstersia gyiorum]|uniref:EpsG family protein n=1 Tax=Kerstersia gyiorum TaxID=206506 RepID=UPI0010707BFB|nr:EpsG family protein [Kerstersia gyiorum]QBR40821.1 hypothetical protein EHF36_09425 [Kerstersia gyiorum]
MQSFRYCIIAVFSAAYALLLSSLNPVYFKDRANYYLYVENIDSLLSDRLGPGFMFNEPLFLYLNEFLSVWFSPDFVISLYVFFIAFSSFFFVAYFSRNLIVCLLGIICLFFNPFAYSIQLGALRQGLCVAVLLWGVVASASRYNLMLISVVLGFVHSSFFLIAGLFFIEWFAARMLDGSLIRRLGLQCISAVVLSLFAFSLVKYFGLRQGDALSSAEGAGSGALFALFFLMALFLVFMLVAQRWDLKARELIVFVLIGLIYYLAMYFLSAFAGRLIQTFIIPLVAVLVLRANLINVIFLFGFALVSVFLFVNGGAASIMNCVYPISESIICG